MSKILKLKNNNKINVFEDTDFSKPQVDSIVFKNKKINKNSEIKIIEGQNISSEAKKVEDVDDSKRMFLKMAGIAGLGIAASTILPKSASAYVAGSTPTSNVVGLKNNSNARINPATEETLSSLLSGQGVAKFTTSLSASGIIKTPTSGKKIRVYASRFSLSADATSVSFRFTAGGTDHEKYVSPKTGGLYGANNHPNYIEGGVDQALYCVINGTTTIQVNIDYLEV